MLGTTSAYSESSFHAQPVEQLAAYSELECAPAQLDRDPDPVYKIIVKLSVDLQNDEEPTDMTIVHVTASGAHYNRADQYTQSSLTKTPGKREWFWVGAWKKDRSHVMRGELFHTVEGKWFYTEDESHAGRTSAVTRSVCHVECDGSSSEACSGE